MSKFQNCLEIIPIIVLIPSFTLSTRIKNNDCMYIYHKIINIQALIV